ncbi:response regulator, partial [Mycolicibacterium smegmatis]
MCGYRDAVRPYARLRLCRRREELSVATVVVADDHSLIREGVVRVLERGGHRVLAVAADAVELLVQVDIHRPDVVVTDIEMPPSVARLKFVYECGAGFRRR